MRRAIAIGRRLGVARLAAAAVAVAALLVAAEAGLQRVSGMGSDGARWIWADDPPGSVEVVTFFAVGEFELEARPRNARLQLSADEEAHLFLNGTLVASRRYRPGDGPAVYAVRNLLRPGPNRLVAEARSARGVGGLLVRLEAEGETLIVTDEEWRVVRRFGDDLLAPGRPLERSEAPRVWGRPPTGRWQLGDSRSFARVADLIQGGFLVPRRARPVGAGSEEAWARLELQIDWRSAPIGREITFDWGEEITACVNLIFDRTETGRGFFWAGDRPIRRFHWPPSGYFKKAPGMRSWSDTEMRRFRYLTVWSDTQLVGARAFRFAAEQASVRLAANGAAPGVFGLDPLRRPQPALQRMWAQLESAPATGSPPGDGANPQP